MPPDRVVAGGEGRLVLDPHQLEVLRPQPDEPVVQPGLPACRVGLRHEAEAAVLGGMLVHRRRVGEAEEVLQTQLAAHSTLRTVTQPHRDSVISAGGCVLIHHDGPTVDEIQYHGKL